MLSGLPTCSFFCLNIFSHHPPQLGPLPSMGVHIMAFLYKIFSEPCLIATFLIHTSELSLLSLPKPSPTSLRLLLRLPIFFGPMKVPGIGGEESGNALCSLGMNEAKGASISLRFLASKVRGHNCGSSHISQPRSRSDSSQHHPKHKHMCKIYLFLTSAMIKTPL